LKKRSLSWKSNKIYKRIQTSF